MLGANQGKYSSLREDASSKVSDAQKKPAVFMTERQKTLMKEIEEERRRDKRDYHQMHLLHKKPLERVDLDT